MAKRGRPSKKVLQKRKELKRKSQRFLAIAILILIAILAVYYFMFTKQGLI